MSPQRPYFAIRILGIFAAVVLIGRAADADDRDAFSTRPAPPNIMFVVDNSGSMMNLPCWEFDTVCMKEDLVPTVLSIDPPGAPTARNVKFIKSTFMDGLGYNASTTYPYPDPTYGASAGAPTSGGGGSAFPDGPWMVDGGTWSRWNNNTSIDTNAEFCDSKYPAASYCAQNARCKYALANFGYFMESSSFKGSGDPSGTCGTAVVPAPLPRACASTTKSVGTTCSTNSSCGCYSGSGTWCMADSGSTKRCGECLVDSDCGTGNECGHTVSSRYKTCNVITEPGNWDTTSREDPAMTGNFLRFYPPKFVVARKVVKDLLTPAAGVTPRQRYGLMLYDSDNEGGKLVTAMGPTCDHLCYDGTCDSYFTANRTSLKAQVDAINFSTNTPLGETLDSVGCYFADGHWSAACSFTNSSGVTFPAGVASQEHPICLSCQYNFAVLLTDGYPTSDTSDFQVSLATGTGDPEGYYLPAVADFMADHDLSNTGTTADPAMAGTQNLTTYTISFGVASPTNPLLCAGVLERAAIAGNGRCLLARDSASLSSALNIILAEIDQRSRTFSSVSLQSARTQGETIASLAVFKPNAVGPMWTGHLFGLNIIDESISNLVLAGGSATDTTEIGIVDANNNQISFDNDGNLLSKPNWDAALCLAGDNYNVFGAITPEDPYNISVSTGANPCYLAPGSRNIKTAVGSTQYDFTAANKATLASSFGVGQLATGKLINFFRGFDMLNNLGKGIDGTGSMTIGSVTLTTPLPRSLSTFGQAPNWWVLGDIYHSNPKIIANLTEPRDDFLGSALSYSTFVATSAVANRQRIIVAGANDGMVHAFDAGTRQSGTGLNTVYDDGIGKELWAFVPPHQMARMPSHISCPEDTATPCTTTLKYKYYVDGTAMARDIYTGTSANVGNKTTLAVAANSAYWKSVMIIGDRDGGDRFTALDITNTSSPNFLWEFPTAAQIGSGGLQRNETAGNSWLDVFPAPATILPVAWDADGVTATTTDVYYRWVALLPGGFDRDQRKGRGIYMVDAYTGELLWKFEYKSGGTTEEQAMKYSFAAAPVGVRHRIPGTTKNALTPWAIDWIFAVDTGGQVWSFKLPSALIKTTTALVSNITGERTFVTAASTATSAAYSAAPTGDGVLNVNEYPYRPMFSIAAVAEGTDSRNMWVYVGTGDRDLIANPNLAHTSGVTLNGSIPTMVCGLSPYDTSTYTNRFYALLVSKGRAVSTRPNNEDDLQNVTLSGSPGAVGSLYDIIGNTTKYGWFLQLRPAEKVVNPPDISQKTVYFTTYTPLGGCTSTTTTTAVDACEAPSGVGRLYALDFQSARPAIDFNPSNSGNSLGTIKGVTVYSSDASKTLGSGVPSMSGVSVGIGRGKATSAIVVPDSNNATPTAIRTSRDISLAKRLVTLDIPKDLHTKLVEYGSDH